MTVRNRLSLQFTFLFAVLLLMLLAGIYSLVERNRKISFYDKLEDRAKTMAQFYLAEDNLSRESFLAVLKKYPRSLNQEVIRIYNHQFEPVFIKEDTIRWDKATLLQVAKDKRMRFTRHGQQVCAIYYADNSGNFIIVATATDSAGIENMRTLAWIMTLAFLASLLITYILGRIFSRMALTPINHLIDNVRSIRASSLDKRLHVNEHKTDEIDALSITINHLLEHLEQSFEAQRVFIANASHELRTPITAILGEAEIALLQNRSTTEYKATLSNVVEDATRLTHLISSLLELAQANMDTHDLQQVRMNELLWEVVDEWSDNGKYPVRLSFRFGLDVSRVTMQGQRHLLFIALGNVVKNAIKFSAGEEVYCELHSTDTHIHISVADKGIGIPEGETEKIFRPFYRSANAMSFTGFGIGLSLTEKIVRLHNGTIQADSANGYGTTFRFAFPR
ncbi:sensor histidine kinase [Chitinophaga qingshengii]|uniref:histidine kinase n=1 Tax=Chitinophaga qingshengii TaxID=1569794 RepID=A0ABR7TLX3_9BACT|nr:HAMP domain-containing sensor histidine kinase [Chitinophaga qingshengii]MBC9930538.1 HAMP domain-containing histidine kinase [Chitinophaga qingshengii]